MTEALVICLTWPTLMAYLRIATYRALTEGMSTRDNLVPDAHLAAILLEHGVSKLFTRDRDFLKLRGLKVEDPFVAGS